MGIERRTERNEQIKACHFCSEEWKERDPVIENEFAVVHFDQHPVQKGHMLILPKEHVSSYFDLTQEQSGQLNALLVEAKQLLDEQFSPEGYNIGINEGEAAGQTVPHLHIHLVPRYDGDVPEDQKRGGFRRMFPHGMDNY